MLPPPAALVVTAFDSNAMLTVEASSPAGAAVAVLAASNDNAEEIASELAATPMPRPASISRIRSSARVKPSLHGHILRDVETRHWRQEYDLRGRQ